MSIDKITTYVENADERTLSQYDNSTRLKALIQFFAEQGQELEDLVHAILINHTLDNATGVILDQYGILLGWERVAEVDEDDEEYRNLLNTGIKVNISDGRAVTIIDILSEHLTNLNPGSTTVISDPGPELVVDGDMEAGPGSDILVDGDAEAVGVGAWTTNGLLTKETTPAPHGGSQVLRIEHNGVANPYARQSIMEIGKSYTLTGWARGDDRADWSVPRVIHNSILLWSGTRSLTWQEIDIDFIASATTIDFVAASFALGYFSDFDDLTVKEACPDWEAGNDPILSKSTASPHGGSQALRVAYAGTTNPYGYQDIMTVDETYEVTGWARGDGTAAPKVTDGGEVDVWTGTSSTDWQEIDVTVEEAASTNLKLIAVASAIGYVEFDDISCITPGTSTTTVNTIVQYIVNSPASYEILWITDDTTIGDLDIDRINQINERILPLGVGSAIVQGTSDAFRLDDSTYGLDNGKLGRRIDNL